MGEATGGEKGWLNTSTTLRKLMFAGRLTRTLCPEDVPLPINAGVVRLWYGTRISVSGGMVS